MCGSAQVVRALTDDVSVSFQHRGLHFEGDALGECELVLSALSSLPPGPTSLSLVAIRRDGGFILLDFAVALPSGVTRAVSAKRRR